MSTALTLPTATGAALRMAREAAHAATMTAAQISAAALIDAAGGSGRVHHTPTPGSPAALCRVSGGGFAAHVRADGPGDRVEIELFSLSPAAWERIGARLVETDACFHDEECDCAAQLPPASELETSEEALHILFREHGERGLVRKAFGRVSLTLYDEPVHLAYEFIRIHRTC